MQERPIPTAALDDPNSVELLRVWVGAKRLLCSIKIGMYREATNIPEEEAWGIILSDIARHVADAMHKEYSTDKSEVLDKIVRGFNSEMQRPTSKIKGKFVN